MRAACLLVANYWLVWVRAHKDLPVDRPLVLTLDGRVRACSEDTILAGVRPGLPEKVVAARCPEALVQEMQEAEPRAAWQRLLADLGRFGPLVESPQEGLAYLPATGLERQYRDELRLGLAIGRTAQACLALPGGVGIADGKFVAEAAAWQAGPGGVAVVPTGAERCFLQPLPVGFLPLSEESLRQLRLLGVQTLEQYVALPYDAVQTRFGKVGCEGWRWAGGNDARPLLGYAQERRLQATIYFDDPVREKPGLEQAVERLLSPLCDNLQREGLACQELQLLAEPERGSLAKECYILREPTANLKRLQTIVLELLGGVSGALQGLTLKLAHLVGLQAGQLDLFAERQLAMELDSALVALTARYGDDCFKRVRAASPTSPLPERRFALERFRIMS